MDLMKFLSRMTLACLLAMGLTGCAQYSFDQTGSANDPSGVLLNKNSTPNGSNSTTNAPDSAISLIGKYLYASPEISFTLEIFDFSSNEEAGGGPTSSPWTKRGVKVVADCSAFGTLMDKQRVFNETSLTGRIKVGDDFVSNQLQPCLLTGKAISILQAAFRYRVSFENLKLFSSPDVTSSAGNLIATLQRVK